MLRSFSMNATTSILVHNEADVRIIWQILHVIFWKHSTPRNILLYLFCSLEKLGLFHLKKSVIFLEIGSAMSSTQLVHTLCCDQRANVLQHIKECEVSVCFQHAAVIWVQTARSGRWCFMSVSPNDPIRSPPKIMSFMKSLACGQSRGLLAFVEGKR